MLGETLFQGFVSNPLELLDHRTGKVSGAFSTLKHKEKRRTIVWVNPKLSCPRGKAELAGIDPRRTTQSDTSSWNGSLSSFTKARQYRKAMELFQQMQAEGISPDSYTFVPVLNACANLRALEEGRNVHKRIIETGFQSDVYVGSCLVDMYAKCGSIEDAWSVFKIMPVRNVVSWNAMLLGYVKCGQGWKTLELFQQMQRQMVEPTRATFLAMLNACASMAALDEGRLLHQQIMQRGYNKDIFVGSSLVDMYAKCGSIKDAWSVFNKMPQRNVVSWNAMLSGTAKFGQGRKALELFEQMQREGVTPGIVTFVAVLNACASISALEEGRHIHQQIIERGYESDVFVHSSLIDMYAKCGSIEDARRVFSKETTHDVAAWNAMILGCAKSGEELKSLELFQQMQLDEVNPDSLTFVGVLKACACIGALELGRRVHEEIIQKGLQSNIFLQSSLVDMYAKCASIEEARREFDKMPTRDVVAWSAMIMGYVKCDEAQKALELYRQMQEEGVDPDQITFVGVLNACALGVALEEGKGIHRELISRGLESDPLVGNSIVNMYAKCGSIEDAERVFKKMPKDDVCLWNTMLEGYAMHGHGEKAIALFQSMCEEGRTMDGFTFVALLSACSHVGLANEGLHYFELMASYDISPNVYHYTCIVDLLGRVGCLHEAEDLINTMSCEPDVTVWMSLLGACRLHGDVEMGEHVAKQLLGLDPQNDAGHVMLANIYAAASHWDRSELVRCM